ncbi:unnamed protein product [Pleuronectes platessa]|uniref:VPS37 C-terminal domain-containing protein n=1 Tax=Pleuronectes platessa TaxID=8262 RepID=A0A9N7Y7H8_PLEPL|nr:unnamed protein product [Pleuronectes platessa]
MSGSRENNSCPDGYRALSPAELRELLHSDGKMDQIIRLNETFQDLQVDRETLLTSNRSLAEESLARRPRLNNGKLQLAEKYRELSSLATTCWEKQSQLVHSRGKIHIRASECQRETSLQRLSESLSVTGVCRAKPGGR